VKDKFLGTRDAGNHVFNNGFAEEFWEFLLTHANPHTWRPESDNLFKFADTKKLPRNLEAIDECIGLHAYEQYYRNIYWSMRNLGVKYLRNKAELLSKLTSLVSTCGDDFDFAVAHAGFRDGIDAREIVLDGERYTDISPLLNKLGIQEKSPL